MIVEHARPEDRQDILAVTSHIDIFTDEEKDTVRELFDERQSGYHFLVARENDKVVGYACFGERALTQGTYDLFWIAVDPSARQVGGGKGFIARL